MSNFTNDHKLFSNLKLKNELFKNKNYASAYDVVIDVSFDYEVYVKKSISKVVCLDQRVGTRDAFVMSVSDCRLRDI